MTSTSMLGAEILPAAEKRFAPAGVNLSSIDGPTAIDTLFALAAARADGYVTITGANGIVAPQIDPRARTLRHYFYGRTPQSAMHR